MASVTPINFKSANLLMKNQMAQIQKPAPQPTVIVQDTFTKEKKSSIKEFSSKYAGITALATTVVGLPVAFIVGKKSGNKALKGLKDALGTMTEKLDKLDIDGKIAEALGKLDTKVAQTAQSEVNKGLISKKSALVTGLLGLGSGMAINEYVDKNRDDLNAKGFSNKEIDEAKTVAASKADLGIYHDGVIGDVRNIAIEAKEAATEAKNIAQQAASVNSNGIDSVIKEYTEGVFGLNLLKVVDWDKKLDVERNQKAIKSINEASGLRLQRSAEDTTKANAEFRETYSKLLKSNSTWALTAEYDPMKMGGLGDVPVDLQNNFTKLGLESPTFIPMYLKKNQGEFSMTEDSYNYRYGKSNFQLDKIAEMPIHAYRNGKTQTEKIEFFTTDIDVPNSNGMKKKIVFVKNDNYFNENIYDSTTGAEETEKFAFFNKAVYNLAKVKINQSLDKNGKTGVADLKITNIEAWNKLNAPITMLLNDWHAGSMGSLLRYRAPMENAFKELNDTACEILKNMPTIMVGHNVGCQGNSNGGSASDERKNIITENIVNTLFDSYASGITQNAHSGIFMDDLCNTVILKKDKVDKNFNALFNGVALADWFAPVSKQYAKEIAATAHGKTGSGIVWELLKARTKTGTVVGIINGVDREKENIKAKAGFVKGVANGLEFLQYGHTSVNNMNKVMESRTENKRRFFNSYLKPLAEGQLKSGDRTPEVLYENKVKFNVSEEDFMKAPFISFIHRLTDQKGLDIFEGAMWNLFDNWDKDFPGQTKPVILVGGPPEDAAFIQVLEKMKDLPNNGGSRVVVVKGFSPNPAIMPACDFFAAPSTYEPCGLTQGQSFAVGTPVVTTRTGGFVDTVEHGKTGFLTKTEITPDLSRETIKSEYKDALVEAIKTWNNKDAYKEMIKNDLEVDFNWAQEGDKGPIFDYLKLFGLSTKNVIDENLVVNKLRYKDALIEKENLIKEIEKSKGDTKKTANLQSSLDRTINDIQILKEKIKE